MKRWIATISIVLLITVAVIWEQTYVNQTFATLSNKVDALMTAVKACGDDEVDTEQAVETQE